MLLATSPSSHPFSTMKIKAFRCSVVSVTTYRRTLWRCQVRIAAGPSTRLMSSTADLNPSHGHYLHTSLMVPSISFPIHVSFTIAKQTTNHSCQGTRRHTAQPVLLTRNGSAVDLVLRQSIALPAELPRCKVYCRLTGGSNQRNTFREGSMQDNCQTAWCQTPERQIIMRSSECKKHTLTNTRNTTPTYTRTHTSTYTYTHKHTFTYTV